MYRKSAWLIFLLFPITVFSLANQISQKQNNQTQLDRVTWRELKQEIEYSRFDNQSNSKKSKINSDGANQKNSNEGESSTDTTSWTFGMSPLIQTIILGLFILFLAIILIQVLGTIVITGHNKTIPDDKDFLDSFDDIPHESDLQTWLKKAKEQSDFKLVIRIYYIMIISTLDDKNLIRWKKEKTNFDYLNELVGTKIHESFFNITAIYNLVWYGDREIQSKNLEQAVNQFDQFFRKISILK